MPGAGLCAVVYLYRYVRIRPQSHRGLIMLKPLQLVLYNACPKFFANQLKNCNNYFMLVVTTKFSCKTYLGFLTVALSVGFLTLLRRRLSWEEEVSCEEEKQAHFHLGWCWPMELSLPVWELCLACWQMRAALGGLDGSCQPRLYHWKEEG